LHINLKLRHWGFLPDKALWMDGNLWGIRRFGLSDDRCSDIQSMSSTVNELREQFKIDDQLHRRVYLYTYAFARPEGQRALCMILLYVADCSVGCCD
jgi:hypothetical protein